jgi:hypothetical protein
MGHTEVFTHVGDAVKIQAPDGRMVTPVVTGRSSDCATAVLISEGLDGIGVFGADDFMHSLFSGQFHRPVAVLSTETSLSQRALTVSCVELRLL